MVFFQSIISCIGRLCLTALFLMVGCDILLDWKAAQQQLINILCNWLTPAMDEQLQHLIEVGMDNASLLLTAAVGCALLGSLLLLLGTGVRLGALLLLLVLIPSTVLLYPFWTMHSSESQAHLISFIKNVGIIGGLLLLLAYGRGGGNKIKEKNTDE